MKEVYAVMYNHRYVPNSDNGYAVDSVQIGENEIYDRKGVRGVCVRLTLIYSKETNEPDGFKALYDNGVEFTQPKGLYCYYEDEI